MVSNASGPGLLGKNDPRSLGDYEIVRRLATGGMAEIYLARHGKIAGLKTLVVVKRILPHLARDEQFTGMFLDEARIVAALDHPNVVRTIEVGVEEDEYFLALELVQGETLARVLGECHEKEQPLDPRMGAFLIAQAASGLHHAHTLHDGDGHPLHVVHRDISPDNILVSFEGAVKVIDFGVARALNRVNHTLQGGPKGKAGYMAPEQARGEPLDARADVFSMGVVLWEVLTGRRLYRRDNDMASLRAIIEEPAPRLSVVAPRAAALDNLVAHALEKDRDRRMASAADLANQLDAFLARGKPIGAADVSAFMKKALPEQRERWREITRSAMALGMKAGDLRLPKLARARPPEDFLLQDDDDPEGAFDAPDTVREDRADVMNAVRSGPTGAAASGGPAAPGRAGTPARPTSPGLTPPPPGSVAPVVVTPHPVVAPAASAQPAAAVPAPARTSFGPVTPRTRLIVAAAVVLTAGFLAVWAMSGPSRRDSAVQAPAPQDHNRPSVAPLPDPPPAPTPVEPVVVPAATPPPPPTPPPRTTGSAAPAPNPAKKPPRAAQPRPASKPGFKPNPFD